MIENQRTQVCSEKPARGITAGIVAVIVITVLAGGLFLLSGGWRIFGAGKWLTGALSGKVMIVSGLAMIISVIGLSIIACILWNAGRNSRRRDRAEEGTAILEFAIVLPFALMLFLIMAQSSMLMGGNINVNYSAYCAARAAVVKIPCELDSEAANKINDLEEPANSGKLMQIWSSAVYAVMPMCDGSYESVSSDGGTLRNGLNQFFTAYGRTPPGWLAATDGRLERKLGYAQEYTKIVLSAPASGDTYTEHEDITVRITHTFFMSVPWADSIFSYFVGSDGVSLYNNKHGMVMRATCTLPNEGVRDYIDVETF